MKFLVKFLVEGPDHRGYCSGEEADGSSDVRVRFELFDTHHELDENGFSKRKEDLDYENEGCTSGGSGYCKGFHQSYVAKWARCIESTEYLDAIKTVQECLQKFKYKHRHIDDINFEVDEISMEQWKRKEKDLCETTDFLDLLVRADEIRAKFIEESEALWRLRS
jgi:hypothetical protein